MSGTATRAESTTETFAEQVLRVTRPVLADLLALVDTYGQITSDEVVDYVCDFRAFMNERYLESIEIYWTAPWTDRVVDGLKYIIVNGEAVRTMERAGGIAYDATIAAAAFHVIIRYTSLWLNDRSDAQKTQFIGGLRINWGPVATPNYNGGSYVPDGHNYGQAAVGISRTRFQKG